MTTARYIYHMADKDAWTTASQTHGQYKGGELDLNDGFIHLSSGEQIQRICALFKQGVQNLVLLKVDTQLIPDAATILKWEPYEGVLYPHLYGSIGPNIVAAVYDLPWDAEQKKHIFPFAVME